MVRPGAVVVAPPANRRLFFSKEIVMEAVMTLHPLAAIGYSILYLLLGGGLGGAVLIFIVAKMLGK
jgi:hypothetical protein